MEWSEEAKKALNGVPFFVRKRVKKRVEEEASSAGANQVLPVHMETCRKRFLTRMEDEVAGYQVETCFGSSGCPNRVIVSDGLVEKIKGLPALQNMKPFLKKIVAGPLKIHHEFRVSLSDCPNACSRPQIADIGIIGACKPRVTEEQCSGCGACAEACQEDAISFTAERPVISADKCLSCGKCFAVCPTGTLKEGEKGYRVLVGGKLGRHPRLATEIQGIHDEEKVLEIIEEWLNYYTSRCRSGERLGEILERVSLKEIGRKE